MFKHKYIQVKDCPVCEKIIYIFDKSGRPVALNSDGMTFWIKFNDDRKAEVAICKDCFASLTQEQIDKFMSDQIYTWGMEIIAKPLSVLELSKQLSWYINTAVHLKIVKYAKDENGL